MMMLMVMVVVRKAPSVSLHARGIGFHCRHVVMTYVWVVHVSLVESRSTVTAPRSAVPSSSDCQGSSGLARNRWV